jgi:hypothetical protein
LLQRGIYFHLMLSDYQNNWPLLELFNTEVDVVKEAIFYLRILPRLVRPPIVDLKPDPSQKQVERHQGNAERHPACKRQSI